MVNECRWLSIPRIEGSLGAPKADAHEEQLAAGGQPVVVSGLGLFWPRMQYVIFRL
jgi:hypothetical protein